MRILSRKILFAMATLLATDVSVAHADDAVPIIRITCIPDIGLFQLETFGLDNVPRQRITNPSIGLYTLKDFVASAPFSCPIVAGDLKVDVVQYHTPQPVGMCGASEYAHLEIKLDGRKIDDIDDTHGACEKNYGHKITATQYSFTHCRSDFDEVELSVRSREPQAVETNCTGFDLGTSPIPLLDKRKRP